jgi:outer membrane cobalamin receptor
MAGRLLKATMMLLLVACASGGSASEGGRKRELISAEEIAAARATHALDLVQQLRPNWLRARGPVSMRGGSPDYPVVYVDGIRSSDPRALENLAAQIVLEIRFLAGRDATTLYGLDHSGGAIMVRTRR